MNLTLECMDMPDHMILRAAGEWTEQTIRHIVDTARERALAIGVTRILVDMQEVSRPTLELTRYLSGKYVAQVMGPRYRIAAVGKPENVTHYAETVARNRGSALKFFTDEESALEWLLR